MKISAVTFYTNNKTNLPVRKNSPDTPEENGGKEIEVDIPYFTPVLNRFVPTFKGDFFENNFTRKVEGKE